MMHYARAMVGRWNRMAIAAAVLVSISSLCAANEGVKVQAAAGEPFGVGRMVVPLSEKVRERLGISRRGDFEFVDSLRISDSGGRVLYPVFAEGFLQLVDEIGDDPPETITVEFLFRGKAPLSLTLSGAGDKPFTAKVTPAQDKPLRRRILADWWEAMGSRVDQLAKFDLHPLQVDSYVMAMLARRLGLRMPRISNGWASQRGFGEILGLLVGAESIRVAMQKKTLLDNTGATLAANQAMPQGAGIPPVAIGEIPKDVKIEPIAMRVPVECFYIRCGSFGNFQWLRSTLDDWGGSIRNMATIRSVDYGMSTRIQSQLAIKDTALSRMFGATIISDVAIIGTDTFLREGAAVGILFQASSSAVLRAQLSGQRSKRAQSDKSVSLSVVDIAGRKVSLLSSPDNSVRSFYVIDDNYHLVTTSRYIARRFLETAKGGAPLGAAKEFRHARAQMPLSRNDSLFVYLSDAFFRNIVSPHYRVEMTRRMRAISDLELVRMAQLAAAAEGAKGRTIDQLIAGKFLPEGFGARCDKSRIKAAGDGWVDSLRGAVGSFLPVPDVKILGVTTAEVASYQSFAQFYSSHWRQMDPVIVAVRRRGPGAAGGGPDRIALDIKITPYARRRYSALESELGPGTKQRFDLMMGDVAFVEVQRGGGRQAFIGIRDFSPAFTIKAGQVKPADEWFDRYPWGYLGEIPKPNLIKRLYGSRLWRDLDDEGYGTSGSYWGRQMEGLAVWANRKSTVKMVTDGLKRSDAPREAQVRVRISDLSRTKLATIINAMGYMHARKVSAGNVYFLHDVRRQFRISGGKALGAAENILAAKLVCPLGGTYVPDAKHPSQWRSTAWTRGLTTDVVAVPQGYRSDLLDWFGGLELDFLLTGQTLSTHIELVLRPKRARGAGRR